MRKFTEREKEILWIVSVCLSVMIFITTILTLKEQLLFEDCLFFSIIVAITPPAVLDYWEYRWRGSINERLPDLFRNIVQAQKTGMSLPRALEEASKRNYGSLTEELKRIVNQMSWGLSFEEALQKFGNRINTSLVQRCVPLIIEASHSGGRVEEVFAPMGSFIQSTLTMEKKRKAQTKPYIAIIYVAFFVFVFTIILLFKTFVVEMSGASIIGFSALSSTESWGIFSHMCIVQAFFGGLVAGKMGEGTIGAGMKHSVILLVSGYASLKLMLW